MRAIIAAVATAIVLAVAAAEADAAWYWAEGEAEDTLMIDYNGIFDAYCFGRGRWIRLDSGLRGYRRFRCLVELTDGTDETGRFHVRGRLRYSFYWD